MKKVGCFLLLLFCFQFARPNFSKEIHSPDKHIKVVLDGTDKLSFKLFYNNEELVRDAELSLVVLSELPFEPGKIKKLSERSVNEWILPTVAEKRRNIPDIYSEITIQFQQPYQLVLRVYNDGIAYRFLTTFKGPITIENELARYEFPAEAKVFYTAVNKRSDADAYHTSFEEPYQVSGFDSLPAGMNIFTPTLIKSAAGTNLVVTESDLDDYPGMFLTRWEGNSLQGNFAGYPLSLDTVGSEFRQAIVNTRAPFIAKTTGSRKFPWRVFIVEREDRKLPENDLVYRLGAPSKVVETSWIKPGQGTDEWIIDIALSGVPFKAGINTATYKYYIDFAKKFGLERILMDAGWSDNNDLFKVNPNLDMDEIARYAKEKGIGLSMWTLALTLDRQLEKALEQFNRWGVDFIMTDFMDRDDQLMVNFYTRVAEACARHKIMIMYHGAFKPAGFSRTWPNAITREAVLGSEYNIWSEKASPDHNLMLPFIRMTSGPFDYEPGILDNATKSTFRPIAGKVMAPGTRCHQTAMFIVFESPITIFSGNPSQGLKEPEFMNLLGSIPTTWDTTLVLQGKIGEYILTARKRGEDWFIGGMTNWTSRQFTLDLSFLEEGKYDATICADGINGDKVATDYTLSTKQVGRNEKINIVMQPGGGIVIRLKKK
ncbi:MAG TPA: glycoside hydrolase family 97 protein [Flavitalea sp.]|nr:glycoside hydrolase family 97 protein [Flavitalea sp.]